MTNKEFQTQFGKWGVVTGASSGIGEEFARQLAAKGVNLVLVARRLEKLEELGKDLENKFNIQTKAVQLDLTDDNFLTTIDKAIKGLDVGVLISNAGNAVMGNFTNLALDNLQQMVKLNVVAQLGLSHYFAKRFSKQGNGGILLVSSMVAYSAGPYLANYSASKGYILNLGESLNYELKDKGVHVTVLSPGPTATEMIKREDADFSKMPMKAMTTEQCVKEGLQALVKNKPSHIPGTVNRIMAGMMKRVISRKGAAQQWGSMMKKMIVEEQLN